MIENEQWIQTDIPMDFQVMVDHVTKQNHRDTSSPAHEEDDSRAQVKAEDDETDVSEMGSLATLASSPKKKPASVSSNKPELKSLQMITVGAQKYCVVNVVLLFIKLMTDYLMCAEQVPSVTTDVLNRVLELLKLFNSRSCQMILGAGALRSAGLKNITAKHICAFLIAKGWKSVRTHVFYVFRFNFTVGWTGHGHDSSYQRKSGKANASETADTTQGF